MRCVACNSPLSNTNKKRKPVTTWAGHMSSVYTDVVQEFPRNEYEDLCTRCIKSVNGISSDLNSEVNVEAGGFWYNGQNLDADFDDESMDGAFDYTEKVYEGLKDK